MSSKDTSFIPTRKHKLLLLVEQTHSTGKGIEVQPWQETNTPTYQPRVNTQNNTLCAVTALVHAATRRRPALPLHPYQIPLLGRGLGVVLRLKLTGYLLSQWANSPSVHPHIALSTALEEGGERRERETGEQTLEDDGWKEKGHEKQMEEECVRRSECFNGGGWQSSVYMLQWSSRGMCSRAPKEEVRKPNKLWL